MAVLHIWEIKILSIMNLVLFHLDTVMLNFLLAIGILQTKKPCNLKYWISPDFLFQYKKIIFRWKLWHETKTQHGERSVTVKGGLSPKLKNRHIHLNFKAKK